jgi:hypothetical protein
MKEQRSVVVHVAPTIAYKHDYVYLLSLKNK